MADGGDSKWIVLGPIVRSGDDEGWCGDPDASATAAHLGAMRRALAKIVVIILIFFFCRNNQKLTLGQNNDWIAHETRTDSTHCHISISFLGLIIHNQFRTYPKKITSYAWNLEVEFILLDESLISNGNALAWKSDDLQSIHVIELRQFVGFIILSIHLIDRS